MKRTLATLIALTLALASLGPAHADEEQARAAFERLKMLAGTWEGSWHGEGEAAADEAHQAPGAKSVFRLASAGSVVMETMAPDSDEEMINMYHLDGSALMVTHYCAGGNQPTMLLNPQKSTADKLYFELIGGTNFDPEVDHHIHAIEMDLKDPDRIVSVFESWNQGEPAGTMSFALARGEGSK